jgi:CheY-like chemotaxis protein
MTLRSDAAAPRAASEGNPAAGAPPSAPPEELIEAQLRAILGTTRTSAGAVCLFDQHQELLRLAVEVGLSDDGCRKLRTVRRGGSSTWDMPLHSLLNRRVYLIESAAKNRYVPPLVDEVALVRAVACVPLYDGATPVGSLILVALAPHTFGERQIRGLEEPVRALVGHILAMRNRVSHAAPERGTRKSLSSGAAPANAHVVGPNTPGLRTAPGAVESSGVQAAVDRARVELERLRGRLAEAEASATADRQRADHAEQERRAAETRIGELQAERGRLSDALAGRAGEVEALEERAGTLQIALDELRSVEAALRAELTHAVETKASHETVASESAAAVQALEARVAELEAGNQQLRDRAATLETAQTTGQAQAAQQAEAESRLVARAAELESQLAGARSDAETLRSRLAELEAEHAGTRAELESRATALAEADDRLTAATESAGEWQRRHEAADVELAAARARGDALARRVEELEQELERTRREDAQMRDGIAHLESLIQTTSDAAPTAASDGDSSTVSSFELVELDEASAADDDGGDVGALVLEEVAAPVAAEATIDAPPPAATRAPEGLLVLDTDAHWSSARLNAGVTVVSPASAAPTDASPARILVKLAAPNALAVLDQLRHAGVTAPCFAFVGVAGQPRGLFVGQVDVAARPIDPDALLAALHGRFKRGTRVVTAGADVDGLISLRQALARLGVSVSMAWDAKQAGDLLGMVNPDVAIVDLELPPKDGCMVVARMGLAQTQPLIVVVPTATDPAAAFAAAITHAELARATVPAKELLERVLAAPLVPPAGR